MKKVSKEQFGIDHPLVTVRDHTRILDNYRKLGFNLSPVSYHPWGTVTSLVMFEKNFIELISVDDRSKFHANGQNSFCFGDNLDKFLQREEGVALLALYSSNADQDYELLLKHGLSSQGRVDFRRAIKTPKGPDEAVVSLALFIDSQNPDLSNFICQQHKPELIWVPEWQNHINQVNGITQIIYIGDLSVIEKRWRALYGDKVQVLAGMIEVDTTSGLLIGMREQDFIDKYPKISLPKWESDTIHAVLIQVNTLSLDIVKDIVLTENINSHITHNSVLISPDFTGNVILEFVETHTVK